ncbi:MAG: cupin domain-containing protein [Acetobacteraceae bacterium]|nr:cupin domain-containing protein [Acetobacteraceae bacterium]
MDDRAKSVQLGGKIRSLRRSLRLTLRQVSEASGLSLSLLSQVERGVVQPSVASLKKIASALNVPLVRFFDAGSGGRAVVRAGQRASLKIPGSRLDYELLTPGLGWQVLWMIIRIEPGDSAQEYLSHPGEEHALVLEGELTVWLGQERLVVGPGDSISYLSSVPHRLENAGDVPVLLVMVMHPPTF